MFLCRDDLSVLPISGIFGIGYYREYIHMSHSLIGGLLSTSAAVYPVQSYRLWFSVISDPEPAALLPIRPPIYKKQKVHCKLASLLTVSWALRISLMITFDR